MENRTNNHSSIRFWIIIACVVLVSAGISFLITSPRHKKRDGGSTVKQYSSTSDNHSDLVQNTIKESQSESNISASNDNEYQKSLSCIFTRKYFVAHSFNFYLQFKKKV